MTDIDFAPLILGCCPVPGGRFELVEWHWPDIVSFERTETQLMLEMSLPPLATDASAYFPTIDSDRRCFMGTLFVRHPGIALGGRSEGGQIRVVRCVFNDAATASIIGRTPSTLSFLKSLLNIRSEALRSLMRLAHRELVNPIDRSPQAMAALFALIEIELLRLFRHSAGAETAGRLAPWQFRRVRERIEAEAPTPGVAELAELCGISPRHLHRQFIALTGKTVSTYIEAHRIEEAKSHLAQPDLPMKQVAQQAGFAHANSFARAFRRATGLSPREYRQRATTIIHGSGLDSSS
ncbi:AraC family transcriptional regulator [Sphingobium sp.]|uniref:AraC family transcriptional regulator n=1 Tax=Sphingobium sp. TaxID=1912891 RepID=UPI002B82EDC0|nr:AraC family transcriptional regulator [Sphingobium sp.]HUD90342.1 AraC family transcriptional regulator [Sphingobium sp.]